MHVVTRKNSNGSYFYKTYSILVVTLQPSNVKASQGLQQCLQALKAMEMIWPSASRAWELLKGVKVKIDGAVPHSGHGPETLKRPAEGVFGNGKDPTTSRPSTSEQGEVNDGASHEVNGAPDVGTRVVAQMLGLDMPGVIPSTSYLPGYEWWPHGRGGSAAAPWQSSSSVNSSFASPDALAFDVHSPEGDWMSCPAGSWPSYPFDPVTNQFGV